MSGTNEINANFRHARLVLAREKDHPAGDDDEGYDLLLPLDQEGRINAREWKENQSGRRVRHFRAGQDDRIGRLRRKPGGQWYFDYADGAPSGETVFRLSEERFVAGEYISIRRAGVMHTYRVAFVDTP